MAKEIPAKLVEDVARELMGRAAIDIPGDYREGVVRARDRERNRIARFVLDEMLRNWEIATAERRPMCADTGLPRYYVRAGNEAVVEGGFVAVERALRRATAEATAAIPLRPNRVHPLTRVDHNNNVGVHAPEVTWAFEPNADWLDVTTVHKGGLFGSDYRMLFPADGVGGIKRFFIDTLIEHGKRGLACQPAIVGVGIGGSKDTCVRLGKEAACLRVVGSRNPDPEVARLEDELTALGNYIGIGAMGFAGTSMVVSTHIEIAFSPTASVRPDGSYAVEAVTATASFRFGKSMTRWFERSGARVIVGKAGLTELAYREWFVPHGAIYLTTVGYGMGAAYGQAIKGVREVHWLAELGIAQAMWVLEVERLGPFLVEGDCAGRSLFALANREIDLRLHEVYTGLPGYSMGRFGEATSRTDEVV